MLFPPNECKIIVKIRKYVHISMNNNQHTCAGEVGKPHHRRQFKKTSVRSREFIAKRAFGIWHFGHSVGVSFARDPASDVASKARSYKKKIGFPSPPTRNSGTKLTPIVRLENLIYRLCCSTNCMKIKK